MTDDADGTDDAALAHVWQGRGGQDSPESVVVTPDGSLTVGFDAVTVAPGASATYLLFEGQSRRTPRAVGERADAAALAETLASASGSAVFAGMTAAEIRGVRNWEHPAPTGALTGPASGVTGTRQTFTLSGLAGGGAGVAACGPGTVSWAVDGAAVAGGASIAASFTTAGAHTGTATVDGDCGAPPLVRTATFTALTTGKGASPVIKLHLGALRLGGGCLRVSARSASVRVRLAATGTMRVSVRVQRLAGRARTCAAASSTAGRALLRRKAGKAALKLTATVSGGQVVIRLRVRTKRSGTPRLTLRGLTLTRGAYRITVTSGKVSVVGLPIVR